jgi:ribosome biogenesis GTPase / thiamine phosphate phosphatase
MTSRDSLQSLGWRPYFESQIDAATAASYCPVRVLAVHRGRIDVAGADGSRSIDISGSATELSITAGTTQFIAANVDTLFIVTSANRDFNIARLERYLAIAHDSGAFPIVVITKADTVESVAELLAEASRLSPGLLVEALDGRDPNAVKTLRPWCESGQTVALPGSSGVGKSTLINTLAGTEQDTQAVRGDDQRGRHTTSGRSMHQLPAGGWLIDTPGMRERLRRYRKLLSEDRRNSESIAERRSRDKYFSSMYKSIQTDSRRRKREKK